MKEIRICFFGDSFVNGSGDPTYLGWTSRVCAAVSSPHYKLTHYNLGLCGNSSQQIEARWHSEATLRFANECDARLVFAFGTNDNRDIAKEAGTGEGSFLLDPKNSLASAHRILSQAVAHYPTLLIGPPPTADEAMNQRNLASSQAYADLAAELAVPYLDTYHPLRQNEVWMTEIAADGYHPAAAGYTALADLILHWSAWQDWFYIK